MMPEVCWPPLHMLVLLLPGAHCAGTAAGPKRLHVRNVREAFGRWSDAKEGAQFDARMGELGVRWCCRPDSVAKAHNKTLHHQLEVKPTRVQAN